MDSATHIILATFANIEDGTEARIAAHRKGFAVALFDVDADEHVGTYVYATGAKKLVA